jgi:hypothetical protein
VSPEELVSALCLNLPIQTAGRFVLGVIVPIPPHTQNIRHSGIRNLFLQNEKRELCKKQKDFAAKINLDTK